MYTLDMKNCPGCSRELPHEAFGVNKSRKDGLQNKCKGCRSTYHANWYVANSDVQKARTAAYKLAKRQFVYDYFKSHPCVDCGESRVECLDLDHRNPSEKEFTIGNVIRNGYSMERLEKEIAKCDVRCANCHRVRTAQQFGWYASLQS